MKPRIALSSVLMTFIGTISMMAANIVQDGSFEQVLTPGTTCTGDGNAWIVNHADVDIIPDDGFHWQAAQGTNSVDLSGSFGCSSALDGSIYQDLPTTPGAAYKLRFALAGNPGGPPQQKQMQILWGDRSLPDMFFDITGRNATNMGWTYYEFLLPATNATTRLTFRTPITTGYGPVIDDVSVEPFATQLTVQCAQPGCSQVSLCWNSVSNASYQLQYRSDLATDIWNDLGVQISGNGTTNCVNDAVLAGQPRKFYRVEVAP